ncbi:MAG: hypothetical protein WBG86_11415 [Polyangiales bacterium]
MKPFAASIYGQVSVLALTQLFSVPVSAQEIPGLPGASSDEDAEAQDPTTAAAIASRRSKVDSELRLLDEDLARTGPENVAHARAVEDELREIRDIMDDHAAFLSRPARAEHETRLPPPEASTPRALNSLYEAQFAIVQRSSERDALLRSSRDALDAAKVRMEQAEKGRRRARVELAEAEPGARANASRTLELQELESRLAQEEVYLRRAETRALQQAEDDEVLAEVERRIDEMRDELADDESRSTAEIGPSTEREGRLLRRREAAERRLATVELALEATQSRYLRRP